MYSNSPPTNRWWLTQTWISFVRPSCNFILHGWKTQAISSFNTIVTLDGCVCGNGKLYLSLKFRTYREFSTPLRPALNGARIDPSDLHEYRQSHQLLGPCCLCPFISEAQPDFVEAAIYLAPTGPNAGYYVASCARDECGYLGELWYLIRMDLLCW